MTWYAHQRFTNPFKKHVSFEVTLFQDKPVLHIYNETSISKEDLLYISLIKNDTLQNGVVDFAAIAMEADSLFSYKQEGEKSYIRQITTKTVSIELLHKVLYIQTPDHHLAIIYDTLARSAHREVDILFALQIPQDRLLSYRNEFRPRLTISDTYKGALPNIQTWDKTKKLFIKEERYNKLSIIRSED